MHTDEDGHEYFSPIASTRKAIADLRGVDYRTVHLQGLVDPDDSDEAWGYAELISDATLRIWECTKNHPK